MRIRWRHARVAEGNIRSKAPYEAIDSGAYTALTADVEIIVSNMVWLSILVS